MTSRPKNEFAARAEGKQRGALRDFVDFIVHNKKWWLTPILVLFLAIGGLVIAGSSGVAPFIYSLF